MHNMAKTSNITPILSPKLKLGNLLRSAISNPISFSDFLISTSTQTGDLLSITSFHHTYTQTDNCNCITMPMFTTTGCQSDIPYDYNTPIYTTTGCQSDTQRDYNTPIRNALPPPIPSTISHINILDAYDSESLAQQLQLDFPTVFANEVTLQGDAPYPFNNWI